MVTPPEKRPKSPESAESKRPAAEEIDDETPSSAISTELLERLTRLGVQIGADGIPDPADTRERPDARTEALVPDESITGRWSPGGGTVGVPSGGVARPGQASERSGRLESTFAAPSPARMELAEAIPGHEADNEHGRCWITEVRRDGASDHASEKLDDARSAPVVALAEISRDPQLADLDIERAAFIDTETTGLAGGTGTFAFLIGAGRFVDGAFRVRQFLMRDPSEEPAQLAALSEWLEGSEGLVTFNGRTFDVPLLDTRYIMNRMLPPWSDPLHLDLLPPARRLWRRRLPSCALTSLEAEIFGLHRQDDVPGWLVPQRYKRFQVEGDARPLVGIFKHNALDILSMVSLLTRVARVWSRPEVALDHGEDWFSLARAYEVAGRRELAVAAFESALRHEMPTEAVDDTFEYLARMHKRHGDWDPATSIWRDMAELSAPRRLFPFEELAKYYEHRVEPRELVRALEYSSRALELVERRTLLPKRGRFQAGVDLKHRIARLERRIAGTDSGAD